jgi:hypothetical protein
VVPADPAEATKLAARYRNEALGVERGRTALIFTSAGLRPPASYARAPAFARATAGMR